MSRNRLIVEACRKVLPCPRRTWPDGFFDNSHLTDADLKELQQGAGEFAAATEDSRSGRS